MLFDPLHVVDRVVDVVEEDLPDAGAPFGELVAPIEQPTVVCTDAGESMEDWDGAMPFWQSYRGLKRWADLSAAA